MGYEILPNIFLGDARDAEFTSHNYALIINCTKNVPFYTTNANTNTIRIPVDDSPDYSEQVMIYNYWIDGRIFEAIHTTIQNNHNILIHCQMGRQRSAATVAAYIIYSLNWPLDRTINFIKTKKPDAFFGSVNFQRALQQLEKQITT